MSFFMFLRGILIDRKKWNHYKPALFTLLNYRFENGFYFELSISAATLYNASFYLMQKLYCHPFPWKTLLFILLYPSRSYCRTVDFVFEVNIRFQDRIYLQNLLQPNNKFFVFNILPSFIRCNPIYSKLQRAQHVFNVTTKR